MDGLNLDFTFITTDIIGAIKRCCRDLLTVIATAACWYSVITAHGSLETSPVGKFCAAYSTFPLCSFLTTHPLQVLGFVAFIPAAIAFGRHSIQAAVAAAVAAAILPALGGLEYIALAAMVGVAAKTRTLEAKIVLALAVFGAFYYGYLDWSTPEETKTKTETFFQKHKTHYNREVVEKNATGRQG